MILPTTPITDVSLSPRRLIIFSHPKVGKTSLLAQLPNNLILDFEGGTSFVQGLKVDVVENAKAANKSVLAYIKEDIEPALKASKHVYDYITLDTATALEPIARELGLILYRNTPMGKNFTGNNVLDLAAGGGWLYVRDAFQKLYEMFKPYAKKCLIIVGHIKTASINKDGKELQAADLDLPGKLRQMVCSDADAIGFLRRDKNSTTNILSFKTSEQDLATGARPEHLKMQEFVISELVDGKLITHWDKIFID